MTTPVRTGTKLTAPIANQQSSPSVQKVVSNVTPNNAKLVANNQGIQQLIVQPGQKLLVGQNSQGQKVIIQPSQQTSSLSGISQQTSSSATTQQQLSNQLGSCVTTEQQQPQKVIQQIVNTSNVQQQIVVGGQRIILSPGQTIVTQRNLPVQSSSVQVVQSPTIPKNMQSTINMIQNTPAPKVVKQFVVQNQQQPPSHAIDGQNTQITIKANQNQAFTNSPSSSTTTAHTSNNNQQQIIVQNSTLAQQLAQGKLQVATINGQQVIIKPLGNNQAQIVAHIKTQSDGNAHIVTNTPADNQCTSSKIVPVAHTLQQVIIISNLKHQSVLY